MSKIMCFCGKTTFYEPPLNDFHTEKIACSKACDPKKQPPISSLPQKGSHPFFGARIDCDVIPFRALA